MSLPAMPSAMILVAPKLLMMAASMMAVPFTMLAVVLRAVFRGNRLDASRKDKGPHNQPA
jgi:hypothetical protein